MMFAAFLLWAGSALAAVGLDDAREMFCRGEWREAAQAAEELGSVDGFLLASVGWRVRGRYSETGTDGRKSNYDRAVEAAEAGLHLAPEDARLLAALSAALGRRCSLQPFRCLMEKNDLERAREALEAGLASSPDSPAMRAALGAWNARAGAAGFLTGGDMELGREFLEAAGPHINEDIPLLFEVARAWRELEEPERTAALYRQILALPSTCAWEQEVQKRARRHLDELEGG